MGVSLLGSWGTFARQVPYLSSVLILAMGLYRTPWLGRAVNRGSALEPGRSRKQMTALCVVQANLA
jgi:hypothetical protein